VPPELDQKEFDRLRALRIYGETEDVKLVCQTFGISRATMIESGKALVYKAAWHLDKGLPHATKYSGMSKFFASDVAMKITTDAIQILGGYDCLKSGNLERNMMDAKITQIYEGTNQVQRFAVGEQLIKEFLEKYRMGRDWSEFL
jgi:hypothetical protein